MPLSGRYGRVADRWRDRRDVVQGEEHAGREQDDERVQRDLAEHERPVVREDLVEERPAALGDAQPLVELGDRLADLPVGAERLFGRLRLALEARH